MRHCPAWPPAAWAAFIGSREQPSNGRLASPILDQAFAMVHAVESPGSGTVFGSRESATGLRRFPP
jgi:hypothetical protein